MMGSAAAEKPTSRARTSRKASDEFASALMIKAGRVVAGMHTNDWDATDHLRACVGQEATDTMRDVSIPLAEAHG